MPAFAEPKYTAEQEALYTELCALLDRHVAAAAVDGSTCTGHDGAPTEGGARQGPATASPRRAGGSRRTSGGGLTCCSSPRRQAHSLPRYQLPVDATDGRGGAGTGDGGAAEGEPSTPQLSMAPGDGDGGSESDVVDWKPEQQREESQLATDTTVSSSGAAEATLEGASGPGHVDGTDESAAVCGADSGVAAAAGGWMLQTLPLAALGVLCAAVWWWVSSWWACGVAMLSLGLLLLLLRAHGDSRHAAARLPPHIEQGVCSIGTAEDGHTTAVVTPPLGGGVPPTQHDEAAIDTEQSAALSSAIRAQRYRFLVAAKWDVHEAAQNVEATLRWRRHQDIDGYRREAVGPFGAEAAERFDVSGWGATDGVEGWPALRLVRWHPEEAIYKGWGGGASMGHSKDHLPIYIERTGMISGKGLKGMIREAQQGQDGLIERHIWNMELTLARFEEASQRWGRRIDKQIVIWDLHGLSFWPSPAAFSVFKRVTQISQTHYPETLGAHFIINSPWIFGPIWKIAKPMLDPNTAAKVQVLRGPAEYVPKLLERIDAQQLPQEFGGSNTFKVPEVPFSRESGETFVAQMREQWELLRAQATAAAAGDASGRRPPVVG
jgi:hypothetical protein